MTETTGKARAAISITAQHEAPQAFAREVPDAVFPDDLPPESPSSYELLGGGVVIATATGETIVSSEDAAELNRLRRRVLAEPTSFRAQQELQSFKALKGL